MIFVISIQRSFVFVLLQSLSPREPVAPSGRRFPGPAGRSRNGQADEEDETEILLRQTFEHLMSVCFGPDTRAKAILHTSLRFAIEGVAYGTAEFPTAKGILSY